MYSLNWTLFGTHFDLILILFAFSLSAVCNATVIAKSETKCLRLDRADFEQHLGPLKVFKFNLFAVFEFSPNFTISIVQSLFKQSPKISFLPCVYTTKTSIRFAHEIDYIVHMYICNYQGNYPTWKHSTNHKKCWLLESFKSRAGTLSSWFFCWTFLY